MELDQSIAKEGPVIHRRLRWSIHTSDQIVIMRCMLSFIFLNFDSEQKFVQQNSCVQFLLNNSVINKIYKIN